MRWPTRWEWMGLATGLAAGWAYWYYVGCYSGTCPITSSPFNSTLYGGVLGWLAGGMIRSSEKTTKTENQSNSNS
ncbi:MAG: hypothetical protein JNL17_10590 [Cyclobacteriaceae bacterium]|nr:hypothetical protein [Cyclobacteriaceae bacterium]